MEKFWRVIWKRTCHAALPFDSDIFSEQTFVQEEQTDTVHNRVDSQLRDFVTNTPIRGVVLRDHWSSSVGNLGVY